MEKNINYLKGLDDYKEDVMPLDYYLDNFK